MSWCTDDLRPQISKSVNAHFCTIQIIVPNKIQKSFQLRPQADYLCWLCLAWNMYFWIKKNQTKVSFVNIKQCNVYVNPSECFFKSRNLEWLCKFIFFKVANIVSKEICFDPNAIYDFGKKLGMLNFNLVRWKRYIAVNVKTFGVLVLPFERAWQWLSNKTK